MNATNLQQKANKIKRLLSNYCLNQADIANALQVDRRSVWQCLNVNSRTGDFILKDPYIREGIARHLKQPYFEIWGQPPEYFNPNLRRSPFYIESKLETEALQ